MVFFGYVELHPQEEVVNQTMFAEPEPSFPRLVFAYPALLIVNWLLDVCRWWRGRPAEPWGVWSIGMLATAVVALSAQAVGAYCAAWMAWHLFGHPWPHVSPRFAACTFFVAVLVFWCNFFLYVTLLTKLNSRSKYISLAIR